MASRKPRIPPRLTRTEQLRQSRSATVVKEYEERTGDRPPVAGPSVAGARRRPEPPKKIDFSRPATTKAAISRLKHTEKLVKEEYERKQELARPRRPTRKGPAPIGGDPRFARERIPRARALEAPIPEKTKELARSINAQVIQAEPIGEGPIDSVVIPPRSVDENRTTIARIPQPLAVGIEPPPEIMQRPFRAITEALDEQDAAESATVWSRLDELQQARRNFVMAMARVGGSPGTPERRRPMIQTVPDIESELFHVEYGIHHPAVEAAREFIRKHTPGAPLREEEEFERLAQELPEEGIDVSFGTCLGTCPSSIFRDEDRTRTFDPEELERFFAVEQYPPPGLTPPPGREHLPPDLWYLQDPWGVHTGPIQEPYREYSQEESLIRFESP